MAYQAKRVHTCTQDFELVEADGTVVHRMKISLDPGSMVEKLSRQHTEVLKAQREVQKIDASIKDHKILCDAYEKLGKAILAMVRSVFGDEQTDIILEFYHGRYNDIVREVFPFISDIVLPDLRRISQENKESILQKYNRKTRRAISRGRKWGI